MLDNFPWMRYQIWFQINTIGNAKIFIVVTYYKNLKIVTGIY